MPDVLTIGETMGLIQLTSSQVLGSEADVHLGIGGTESNVAIGLSRLGHRVRWVSSLGNDVFGRMIAETITSQDVEVVPNWNQAKKTGLMVKSPSLGHERKVTYYREGSAASYLQPDTIPDSLISDCRLVHLTGVFPALSESTRRTALDMPWRVKSLGKQLSFDVNFRSALWSESRARIILREIASSADVVFGDRRELELLVDNPSGDNRVLVEQVAQLGPSEVILKLGAEGATSLISGNHFSSRGFQVEVLDTVGAGDAFVAGYLSAFLDGKEESERLERANFCGALACTRYGDWEGAPTRAEFEQSRRERVS